MFVPLALGFAQVSSTVSLNNGVQLEITAHLGQPTGEETLKVEMTRASGNSFYRMFRDQNQLIVFAYELSVNLTQAGDALRATAKPVETEFAARFPNADAGKPVPSLSSDHEMGPLSSGQSADIGLFEIPGMGLKVSETIRVRMSQESAAGALHFTGLRVSIAGGPASPPPPGSVAGRYAMFYIPGRGGYFFATEDPGHAGFVKAGNVDRTEMRFTLDNENYVCTASAPILGPNASSDLWVFHDAKYRPAGNWTRASQTAQDQFYMAAADSLNWWLQ
jgi:hypothetical protein